MGSSTASETTINTSTDSANTMVTMVGIRLTSQRCLLAHVEREHTSPTYVLYNNTVTIKLNPQLTVIPKRNKSSSNMEYRNNEVDSWQRYIRC